MTNTVYSDITRKIRHNCTLATEYRDRAYLDTGDVGHAKTAFCASVLTGQPWKRKGERYRECFGGKEEWMKL